MAFAISSGQLTGLDRAVASSPLRGYVNLSEGYTQDYATIWRTQPHVRTVVGFLARNIAQLGIGVYERVSDTDRARLVDHPLASLLTKPNAKTTRYRMIDALINDLGIYDNAFWAKVSNGSSSALLRLPAAQMSPVGDNPFWPEGYKYRGSRGEKVFAPEDIVHFRGYNPSDARWGVSPMETLRQILAEEWNASQYREQLWKNGARFPGHIRRPKEAGNWSDAARERFRTDWRGLYTGDGPGTGGTPVLEDGMTFEGSGITPAQAQYLETRKLTREEVASAYHIPLPMVGILDHATFSNIEEQHKNLYQDTLGPWLTMIQEEIELQLLPDLDASPGIYVEFNLAEKMRGSFEEQATSLQTSVGGPWLTRNEARARQNLPSIDGGDELIVPLNVVAGGQSSPTDSGTQNQLAGPRRRVKSRVPDSHEEKYRRVLGKFFDRQSSVVKSNLGAKSAADWWDAARWNKELGDDLYGLHLATSAEAAKKTLDGAGLDPDAYDVARTHKYVRKAAENAAMSINETTKAQIDSSFDADDPTVALTGVFETAKTSRAAQIAVTAVTAMSSFGTVEAASQQSTDATKTWVTGPNARASHAAMNGETVGIEEQFSNGLSWPGGFGEADEVAGCNCDVEVNF